MFELHAAAVAVCPRVRAGDPDGPITPATAVLQEVVAVGPGPAAMALLDTLNHDELDDHERVELLEAWERNSRWVAAQQTKAVVAVAGPRPIGRDDLPREFVRAALLDSGGSAKAGVDTARALAGPLRAAREAMEAGRLSYDHARVLVQETWDLDPVTTAEIAASLIDKADDETPSQFRRLVRRAVVKADPTRADDLARDAKRRRMVSKRAEPDYQASMFLTGPATDVQTIWSALDVLSARTSAGDMRNLDQRRFDSLVGLCSQALQDSATTGTRCGVRPGVYLFADAATWFGLADEPVELDGYGPIPPGIARGYLHTSTWRAMVTDALAGTVLSVSDLSYRPSARTRRLLHVRDRRCTFPGCSAAVWFCDADHNTPYDEGGCTDPDNCGLLCRRHHRLKTFANWRWRRNQSGDNEWTDPTGRTWIRRTTRYLMPHAGSPPDEGSASDPPSPPAPAVTEAVTVSPDDDIPPF